MTDATEEERAEEEPREQSFWARLSPDVKLLAMTFGGTLAANVVTVVVVAVGITLARAPKAPTIGTVVLELIAVASGGSAVVAVLLFVTRWMSRNARGRRVIVAVPLVLGAFMAFLAATCLLALIGDAAGVK